VIKLQARRLLLVALALSLLIHLAVATRFQWSFTQPQENVQVERIARVRAVRIARQTPPPFTPSPQPSPPKTIAKQPKPIGINGVGPAAGRAVPTPAPTPVASATPNCFRTDTPASVIATPDPPSEIPATVRAEAKTGVSSVQVKIDPTGVVTAATVTASSGSSSLDLIAEDLARRATYAPATHQCKAIASEFVFEAKWFAW
jgi:TonB family protein